MSLHQPLQSSITYTSNQVAEHMGLDPEVFRKLCAQGHGPASINLDGAPHFRPESLNLWRLYGRGAAR